MKIRFVLALLLTIGVAAPNLSAAPKEGDLIQAPSGALSVIRDGKRSLIPSMNVFDGCGFKRENIIKVSDEEMSAIPAGPVLTKPNKPQPPSAATALNPYNTPKQYDIIQSPAGAIYVILDGKRCQIPNMEILNANGLKSEDIIKISDEDLNAIPVGPKVE
ncbi:MAG: hypothetical protein D4R65_10200 [Verrucomicrobiaceae bacterium]|nr:MAG: hypothetical protein D4R65_10200 [Verrucomicrobiaceae bacterium]